MSKGSPPQNTKSDSTQYRLDPRDIIQGAQMLLVAFGALVLVPILTGLNPNVALFTAGLGTLCFQWITGGKIPVFLGSSFAFIAPITISVRKFGLAETLSGLLAAGALYLLLSLLIFWRGSHIVTYVLPTIVTGPVIMVIGLSLAPIAIKMATEPGDGISASVAIILSSLSFLATILTVVFARRMLRLIPILVGILAGYLAAMIMGLIDFAPLRAAPWIAIPNFTTPVFHGPAMLYMLPVAIAPAIEHIGDILVVSSVTGQPFLQHPGLHRTLLGDGLATSLAACLGGPPNTTYSEVTGAVALTRSFNAGIMTWAAIIAIILSFSGKLEGLLSTIPAPVMGGVLVILFGTIVVVGMDSIVKAGEDLLQTRNLIIVGAILILGVGGMRLKAGQFALEGIGASSIIGIILNLLLPRRLET
ncbi:uracil-xanthine permease family protein [Acaryochloris sp. IP29b_bin.137]|uniref:uracil-xanthine permease family protein n=1 Tax=Acaryochloris sp. IP29b_bin.137 TaxID=2969217 RepID=UPI00260A202F|nr:uracil-xanthine permease family protein [Acaryochloris sp. IP29b_bin.137]